MSKLLFFNASSSAQAAVQVLVPPISARQWMPAPNCTSPASRPSPGDAPTVRPPSKYLVPVPEKTAPVACATAPKNTAVAPEDTRNSPPVATLTGL